MRFWRKRRKMAKFDPSALPAPKRISLDRAIDEGLLLAEYATRMETKNQVIVGALRGDRDFDVERYAEVVRANLARLAAEAHDQALRISGERRHARESPGLARGHHDYRRSDVSNLQLREQSYSGLAAKLIELSADDEYVNGIVEAARAAAWEEVGDVVVSTLAEQQEPADLGENYAEERLIRMQLLQMEDLEELATQRRHSAPNMTSAAGAAEGAAPRVP